MRHLPLAVQGLYDLVKRYLNVLRNVWRIRAQLEPPKRSQHEAEFLPAALALQETPVSPAPRIAMWLIIAFALIALIWSIFGQVEVVATAHGKIVPNDRSKVIQPFETATVKRILVSDGQTVVAGDTLLELDATNADADSTRSAHDLLSARLQALRAKALLEAISSAKPAILGAVDDIKPERLAQEQKLLSGQYNEYKAKIERLDAEIKQREAERHSTQEIVDKLKQTAPIARQRAQDFKALADQNFVSKHAYLEKEQARIEQEGDLAMQKSRIRELNAALQAVSSEKNTLTAETRRIALDSLNEAEQKTSTFSQELIKADSRSKLLTLNAPVSGTVQQLATHTVGGVVTPAQALMIIVPSEDSLEIEAFIENKDIGFVNPGQEAQVKIETFPFTKYGTVRGRVTQVSNDAINDEKKGLIYSTRVKLDKANIQVDKKLVKLSPGMAVTVEIKTGMRRVIEYFLSPLLQYQNESLRER
ncbi:MAG: HlyD family type I secretion periplasmic adaptor subunit [Pseudomonadota bacterium]